MSSAFANSRGNTFKASPNKLTFAAVDLSMVSFCQFQKPYEPVSSWGWRGWRGWWGWCSATPLNNKESSLVKCFLRYDRRLPSKWIKYLPLPGGMPSITPLAVRTTVAMLDLYLQQVPKCFYHAHRTSCKTWPHKWWSYRLINWRWWWTYLCFAVVHRPTSN